VQVQAAIDVPGGQAPALLAAQAGDLGGRVVVLERLDPQAGERGAHVIRQTLGDRHEDPPAGGDGSGRSSR
jgi:hypothetical protein